MGLKVGNEEWLASQGSVVVSDDLTLDFCRLQIVGALEDSRCEVLVVGRNSDLPTFTVLNVGDAGFFADSDRTLPLNFLVDQVFIRFTSLKKLLLDQSWFVLVDLAGILAEIGEGFCHRAELANILIELVD